MKINTKYSTDEKVWFYIEKLNKYAWGKIVSMEISVRCGTVDVVSYNINNRFYNKDSWKTECYGHRDFRTESYLSFKEEEVFENPEQIRKHLNVLHNNKMLDLEELKKGLFA